MKSYSSYIKYASYKTHNYLFIQHKQLDEVTFHML